MKQNIVEDLVIPEVPKVIPNQEMYVYVPVATYESKGIANFDSVSLTISNGTVSVKESFVDSKIVNGIVQIAGQNLELAIDNSTFVLTAKLKNGRGEVLGEVQTVDLPLESVVVNGSYDNESKTLVLTLQNGNSVNIPISDLIDGLASIEYLEANASLLKGGTPIAEGTDLNTLTTPGNYYFSPNDEVFTLSNCPIISAFTMKVFYSTENSGYYLKQEIKQYNTASYLTRHSENAGSTWSPWSKYAIAGEVVSKSGGTITGSLVITGDLIVQGTKTSVNTQNLNVQNKLIYVAKDNITALSTPAGLITPYYDGKNSGGIIYDNTGTAYVGDVVLNSDGDVDLSNSNVWPLCARDKSNNWVNGHVPVWDSANEKLVDSGKSVGDFSNCVSIEQLDAVRDELKSDLGNLENVFKYSAISKNGYINVFNDCESSDIFNVSGGDFCVTGENILDTSSKVSNKIKNDSGEEVSDSTSSYYSRKIPVVPEMILSSNFAVQRFYLLDSNGTFIKRTQIGNWRKLIIPSDVYFVQVQISNDVETESMMLNFGSTVSDYSAFKINTDGIAYEGINIVGFREQATKLSVTLVKKISSVETSLTGSNEKLPTSKAVLDKLEIITGKLKTVTLSGKVIVIDKETTNRISEITLPNNSYSVGKNIFDQSTRVIDKIKDNSGVEVYDTQSNYFSIYIPVNGMSFKANFDIQRCYLYDENKTFLRRYTSFIYSGTEFSFSNEVYFIQVQMLVSDITNTLCIVYGDNDTTYSEYKVSQNSVPYGEEFSVFIDGVQDCELSMSLLGLKCFIPKVSSYDIWEPSMTTDDYSCTPLGQDSQSIPSLTNTLKYQGFLETYFDIYLGDYSDGYSVKREDLGLDSGATATDNYASPIYSYEFKPKYYNKTVLLSAGMNTCEASTYFGLAYFIKALMEHTESGMLALYNSTRFIVIPVICPSGIAHNPLLYANSNNVRINKNFEYYGSWERLKTDRGGSYPDSEVETKVLKSWLNKYADSAFWLDCHSDTGTSEAYLHLGTIFCSDATTASKLDANKQKIIDFYKDKGYYSASNNPTLGFSAQERETSIYPKTVYAKEVTRIPSAMMEQFMYSTAWGSDGNTNNDSYAIKHYVTMIRYMVLEMCKDSDKFIY